MTVITEQKQLVSEEKEWVRPYYDNVETQRDGQDLPCLIRNIQ